MRLIGKGRRVKVEIIKKLYKVFFLLIMLKLVKNVIPVLLLCTVTLFTLGIPVRNKKLKLKSNGNKYFSKQGRERTGKER